MGPWLAQPMARALGTHYWSPGWRNLWPGLGGHIFVAIAGATYGRHIFGTVSGATYGQGLGDTFLGPFLSQPMGCILLGPRLAKNYGQAQGAHCWGRGWRDLQYSMAWLGGHIFGAMAGATNCQASGAHFLRLGGLAWGHARRCAGIRSGDCPLHSPRCCH